MWQLDLRERSSFKPVKSSASSGSLVGKSGFSEASVSLQPKIEFEEWIAGPPDCVQYVAVYAVNSKIMYSVIVFCCSCCALYEAVAGSVYMTYP
jgi:hypothetical protein